RKRNCQLARLSRGEIDGAKGAFVSDCSVFSQLPSDFELPEIGEEKTIMNADFARREIHRRNLYILVNFFHLVQMRVRPAIWLYKTITAKVSVVGKIAKISAVGEVAGGSVWQRFENGQIAPLPDAAAL